MVKKKSNEFLEKIAEHTLSMFQSVADTARAALRGEPPPGPEIFASTNTFTNSAAARNLSKIHEASRASCEFLTVEPAIARIAITTKSGAVEIRFICRTMPILGMASYRSEIGRLASLEIGDTLALSKTNARVTLVEKARLRPYSNTKGWDSRDSVLEGSDYGPLTIASMRALVTRDTRPEVDQNLLERLLAEAQLDENVQDGLRRSVIIKIGLRDQPILDKYQDEIFRLPLSSQILLLGSPGTGKTTTLIRRLGQKLDLEFLSSDEREVLQGAGPLSATSHTQSWLMFTPTELLKQYVKEAFGRENIAASDLRISTWSDYRRDIARNTLNILRSSSGRGAFALKEDLKSLANQTEGESINLFSQFNEWQKNAFLNELRTAAGELADDQSKVIATVGSRLRAIVNRAEPSSLTPMFASLNLEIHAIQALVSELKQGTDNRIRGTLNIQVNSDNEFLEKLAAFIDGIEEQSAPSDEDLEEQDEDDEEEPFVATRTGRLAALSAYLQAARSQARAHAQKRSIRKTTRNGKILLWLGDRCLKESDRSDVGGSLLVQTRARRFLNPVRRYVGGTAVRYRAFRKSHLDKGKLFARAIFSQTDIHPLELDVVLLATLRNAADLLRNPSISRDLDAPNWAALRPIRELHQNQVVVDEVADFSPVQLGCMAALANLRINSFFACGDFNQRLTTWGTRSLDEAKWALPGIDVRVIRVSYRHTTQLNDFARLLIQVAGGAADDSVLPNQVDNNGFAPALAENKRNRSDIVQWLKDRILEIETFVGQLPSIGVLVNSEDEVGPLADELKTALASSNIQVVPCPNGQVMGRDNDIRVFNVEHIKGLEFEAAFFIGIDGLAKLHPTLVDKYLYVGATRAATYLGITCEHKLPKALSALRSNFVNDWKLGRSS